MQNSSSSLKEHAQKFLRVVVGFIQRLGLLKASVSLVRSPQRFWQAQLADPWNTSKLLLHVVLPCALLPVVLGLARFRIFGIAIPVWGTWRAPLLESMWFYLLYVIWFLGTYQVLIVLIRKFLATSFAENESQSEFNLQLQISNLVAFSLLPCAIAESLRVFLSPIASGLALLVYVYSLVILLIGLRAAGIFSGFDSERRAAVFLSSLVVVSFGLRVLISAAGGQDFELLDAPRPPGSSLALDLVINMQKLASNE